MKEEKKLTIFMEVKNLTKVKEFEINCVKK